MPFTKQQADKLIQNIDAIFAGGKTAEAIDQLKAVLMKTNTYGDGEAEMARVGLHLKERLKHSPDKAWSPISRLIHIHTVADISAKDKNGRTLLQCALQLNDHDALKLLTQTYGANVDTAQDEEGNVRLHLAVKAGDLKKTQTLIDAAWADVNIKNKQGATPLHIAAEEGHLKIIEFLVGRKAKVDALDEHSNTPFHRAAKKGRGDVLSMLLWYGADRNAISIDGNTALHFAAMNGHKDAVMYLFAQGANVAAQDKHGDGPLHCAALANHAEVVKCLVEECKAGIETGGAYKKTALHTAAMEGCTAVVTYLLTQRANVAAQDEDGYTPLHLAAFKSQLESCQLLIQHKADVSHRGMTALLRCTWRQKVVIRML